MGGPQQALNHVNKRIQGIAVRRGGLTIRHLFFADNALFFFKATLDSRGPCGHLKELFSLFCDSSMESDQLR